MSTLEQWLQHEYAPPTVDNKVFKLPLVPEPARPKKIPFRDRQDIEVILRGEKSDHYARLCKENADLEVSFNPTGGDFTITERVQDPEEPCHYLEVTVHLNRKNSELLDIRRFSQTTLLIAFAVADGKYPWMEYRQSGFQSARLPSLLSQAVKARWRLSYIKVLLPLSKHPRSWTAVLALMTFKGVDDKDLKEVKELYKAVERCQSELFDISQRPGRASSLKELIDEEEAMREHIKLRDPKSRTAMIKCYEQLVDDIAVAQKRTMWLKESDRLAKEQEIIYRKVDELDN
ncbi:hypothetical protein GTR04_4204 [Trichophyton interdigitale]|uniref:Uncharacterized protein n=3 Tax=Trichophyton TaxID=5550 RepID=A0A9P4YH97_9EURO|nr:hypothetical protein TESG_05567 [Trichophyton tonsurans CBS 112818]EGE01604.1 hypothetical protein TEQG_00649 [Trichophyton equinum CBS 127.97]KAF3892921.1 hypothetical protein GY631_3946 [Trichophyton interdigitale]KAF3894406.1 hypothetical protein GY632_3776 [Trichophyton interdigitale]KAG8208418.1 hypothetical protein GTR04_4204 [Trichophyton interdigitale]